MKVIEVPIDSLSQSDLDEVSRRLLAVDGVAEVTVMEITGQILIYCEDEDLSRSLLEQRLAEGSRPVAVLPIVELVPEVSAGDESPSRVREKPAGITGDEAVVRLRIDGMHCSGCEQAIENLLLTVSGVETAKAELITGRAMVTGHCLSVDKLQDAVSRAGYRSQVVQSRTNLFASICETHRQNERKLLRRWILACGCVFLLALSLLIQLDTMAWWWAAVSLATVVQLVCGGPYLVSALRLARYRQTNMDTLIAMGTTAAYLGALRFGGGHTYHMLMESPMILGFVGIGKWLESLSINRAVSQLASATQTDSMVLVVGQDGEFHERRVEDVASGSQVLVRSGEKTQLDGIVIGTATVSRAWLTGEVMPIELDNGDLVYAGSINEGDSLRMEVTSESGETRFDHIMSRLEQSLGNRPQVQQLADRIVAVFVPILILIAVFTFSFWAWRLGAEGIEQAWRFTVAVLVIACPCALGLATPVATLISGTRSLTLGGLVSNPNAMELLADVRDFVLDKTGTLTTSHLVVHEFDQRDGRLSAEQCFSIVLSLEQQSTHPIARALVEYCKQQTVAVHDLPVSEFKTLPGIGVKGVVGRQTALIVNDRYVADVHQLAVPVKQEESRAWLIVDDVVTGCFSLTAAVLPEAVEMVQQLRGFSGEDGRIVIASGDHLQACQMTGQAVGIDEIYSEMSPEEKAELIQGMGQSGRRVVLMGDGINDALALAEADVGIAAYGGADIAAQSADIVMLKPGLGVLCDLIRLSRKTSRIIRQNLVWAFLYNVLAIPLAAGVFSGLGLRLNPMIAAGIMASSSILVVLNSLRLKRISLV